MLTIKSRDEDIDITITPEQTTCGLTTYTINNDGQDELYRIRIYYRSDPTNIQFDKRELLNSTDNTVIHYYVRHPITQKQIIVTPTQIHNGDTIEGLGEQIFIIPITIDGQTYNIVQPKSVIYMSGFYKNLATDLNIEFGILPFTPSHAIHNGTAIQYLTAFDLLNTITSTNCKTWVKNWTNERKNINTSLINDSIMQYIEPTPTCNLVNQNFISSISPNKNCSFECKLHEFYYFGYNELRFHINTYHYLQVEPLYRFMAFLYANAIRVTE